MLDKESSSDKQSGIETNIFPITVKDDFILHEYQIEFSPEKPRNNINNIYQSFFNGNNLTYDNLIFSKNGDIECEKEIDYEGNKIKVKIMKIKQIKSKDKDEILKVLDILLRRILEKNGYVQNGNKWFNNNKHERHGFYNIVNGFIVKTAIFNDSIYLMIKNTERYERIGTVYEFIKNGITNLNTRKYIKKSIKNMHFLTCYSSKQKFINFNDILWDLNSSQKTKIRDKTQVNLAQYFQETYGFRTRINDPVIESVKFKNNEKQYKYYPSSSIKLVGLTEIEKNDLNLKIKTNILEYNNKIKDLINIIINNMSSYLNGIEILNNINVDYYTLEYPSIVLRTRQSLHNEHIVKIKDFETLQKEIYFAAVAVPPQLNSKPLLVFSKNIGVESINKMSKIFCDANYDMGIDFQAPDFISIQGTDQNIYGKNISKYILTNGVPSFILFILKDYFDDVKCFLKKFLSIELGIPFFFCKPDLLLSNDNQYLTKVITSITVKTGGIPYYISPVSLPLRSTMVVGITTSKFGICSMTASYDFTFSRYISEIYQNTDSTISKENIKYFFKKAINSFNNHSNSILKRIVVYRKSIDSKVNELEKEEIDSILEMIGEISLIYCIVEKDSDIYLMNENVKPGTVINCPNSKDFYLISKPNIPTKYKILYNTSNVWDNNHFKKLTFYLTFCYPNHFETIKIPLPLRYAIKYSKFCFSVLNSKRPNKNLQSLVHYL